MAQAQSGPLLYVPNSSGAFDVSVVDTPTNTLVATIPLGAGLPPPTTAAVRGDEALAYVTGGPNGVAVINTGTNTVVTTITAGNSPAGVAVSPDATRLYVTNAGSGDVSVIDTATNTVVTTVGVGSLPVGAAVSPNGSRAYVTNRNSGDVSVINTASNTVVATVGVGSNPVGVAVSRDSTRVYVANLFSNTVSVIDTATNTVIATIPVGNTPAGVAVTPDNTRVYVANELSNTVSVIDTATNTVVANVAIGGGTVGVAISPDGTRAYATNLVGNNVSVIDTGTNTVVANVAVGTSPIFPGICSNGNALLASGLTFTARTSGALACTLASGVSGASGPVFTGGTLQIAGANITSSLPVTLQSQGGTIDTNGNSATLSGPISGPGTLVKVGAGTLTLTGNNSYQGGTALNAGTLAVGSNTALGPGTLTFADGTTLQAAANGLTLANAMTLNGAGTVDSQGNALALSGPLSGTGSLVKIGAGTLTLTGNNSYQGGTALNVGTLAVGSSNALGTGALTFANGTTLQAAATGLTLANAMTLNGTGTVDSQGNALALSGTISGSGTLTKIGAGTLTLTGSNSYQGGTALNAGTLAVAADNNLGNTAGVLAFGGGTLQYLAGFSSNRGVTVNASGGTIDTNGNNATLGGSIGGVGSLTKTGAGALTLTGISSYSGATAVNVGTLIVNGSIANSAVTVNAGAMLSGIGTVGATTIASGGTFAPGNSPGTMTVAGNLAFQSGALYVVQVNPSTASSVNVTAGGSATLAGTVQASFASGSYATRTYTILSAAGGLGGTTFNTLTTGNLPAGFTASLSYTATDAILNLTATLGQSAVGPSAPGQPSAPSGPSALACAFSINQCNVANALNAFFNNGGALPPAFVTIFGLTGANLGNALSLLSGEAATGAQQGAFQLTNQFLGIMLDPFVDRRSGASSGGAIGFAPAREELPDDIALAYAKLLKEPPAPSLPSPASGGGLGWGQPWSVWGAGYGGSNRTSGDPAVVGSHDLSAVTAGGAAGLDYRLAPGTVVGFALAGGGTNWGLAEGIGTGKSDAFQAGVYGTTRSGPAYLAAALAFTNHWMSTDRFAFAGDHLTASFNAQSFGGRVEGGYRIATIYGGLTPYAAIQAQNFRTPSYSEADLTSGGFALGFNSRNATDTRSELGGRFDRLLLLNPEAALTLRTRVAWAHDWISDPSLAALFQTLPGASFIVNGATPAKNSALTSAGVELRLANGVVLLAKFDGEFASHASTYAGTGIVRYTW
jgi:outer membrane autotransporter protein